MRDHDSFLACFPPDRRSHIRREGCAKVVGIGVVIVLQAYVPQMENQVEAAYTSHRTPVIETTDLEDDDGGITHASEVYYKKWVWPTTDFRVTKVSYGGRHPDRGFWWTDGKWKREYTRYEEREDGTTVWDLVLTKIDN